MAQLLSTNVTGTLNCTNIMSANASPLANLGTQVFTGTVCTLTANAQTNSNIAQTNVLSCTFNETGIYQIEGMFIIGWNKATANAANLGLNIAIGKSGTATINTIQYALSGRANGTTVVTNLIVGTAQSIVIPNTTGSLANSSNNSDYLLLQGTLVVNVAGTINLEFASANSTNGNVNVSANSYVLYTKIG